MLQKSVQGSGWACALASLARHELMESTQVLCGGVSQGWGGPTPPSPSACKCPGFTCSRPMSLQGSLGTLSSPFPRRAAADVSLALERRQPPWPVK